LLVVTASTFSLPIPATCSIGISTVSGGSIKSTGTTFRGWRSRNQCNAAIAAAQANTGKVYPATGLEVVISFSWASSFILLKGDRISAFSAQFLCYQDYYKLP
jgi:hypothetical protein